MLLTTLPRSNHFFNQKTFNKRQKKSNRYRYQKRFQSDPRQQPKSSRGKFIFGAGILAAVGYFGYQYFSDDNGNDDIQVLQKKLNNSETENNDHIIDELLPVEFIGKDKLVILGSGWATISLLLELGDDFDVTVVSPRNYFLFTPLLPSVTTGKLEDRTVIEPIRKYLRKKSRSTIRYYEAECYEIDPVTNTVSCRDTSGITGEKDTFALNYDYLVVAVGSECNTFGTPGVYENASFLKSLEDGRSLRNKIMDCFETASLPQHTDEEKKQLLNFCVVGGGPTGVEFAGELKDFIREDLVQWFPDLKKHVSITLFQSADHILNTFDKSISEYSEKNFLKNDINVLLNRRVKEVKPNSLSVLDKKTGEISDVPFGICVWSTGITQIPLIKDFISKLGTDKQPNRRALLVNEYLNVIGVNNVFAIGDCSTVETKLLKKEFEELFELADTNEDGFLSIDEISAFVTGFSEQYPQLDVYKNKIFRVFEEVDVDKSGSLSRDEFRQLIELADNEVTLLPATAQVASQQGKYLGTELRKLVTGETREPFKYTHLGSFAFIGDSAAVGEIPGIMKGGGWAVWWMWKGIYLGKQFSWKNTVMISLDWTKAKLFGRDVSRF